MIDGDRGKEIERYLLLLCCAVQELARVCEPVENSKQKILIDIWPPSRKG